MRTTTKAAKASTETKSANTTRVCISTAETIAGLADTHGQPPAVIAGAIAEIGCSLICGSAEAIAAETSFEILIMKVIQRRACLPTPKCVIPILVSEWTGETSQKWAGDMGMTFDEWLRCMVEIGVKYYHKGKLLDRMIGDAQAAFFLTRAAEISADNDTPEARELLRPAPEVPPAFISFERVLAAKGGAARE